MKRVLKWIFVVLVVVFALLQLTNLGRTNPAVAAGHDFFSGTNAPPAEISTMLRNACYDCHSYETRLPWYGHVAPVSWWLANHVLEGRQHLNFSHWPHDDPRRAAKWFRRIADTVDSGDMPLPGYDRMHPAARLDAVQRSNLVEWAQSEASRLRPADESATAN